MGASSHCINFLLVNETEETACVRISGNVPTKLSYESYAYSGYDGIFPVGSELVIVNCTLSTVSLNNMPCVSFAWDFSTKRKTQRTKKGDSIAIPYQSRQSGNCWLTRWDGVESIAQTSLNDIFIFIFDMPPSNQVHDVITRFASSTCLGAGEIESFATHSISSRADNVRLLLWRKCDLLCFHPSRHEHFATNSEITGEIWKDVNTFFHYVSPELQSHLQTNQLSQFFSTIFGSVCTEEDTRTDTCLTIPLPKSISIPAQLMELMTSTTNVDLVTIGSSSSTMKFKVTHTAELQWAITFVCKLNKEAKEEENGNAIFKVPQSLHENNNKQAAAFLSSVVKTTNEFDARLIFEMMHETLVFAKSPDANIALKCIWDGCILRGNEKWQNKFLERGQFNLVGNTNGLHKRAASPMRSHSCLS